MEAQSFDTQRHLPIDFTGSLESISIMSSVGIVFVSEFSLSSNKVLARVLRLDFLAETDFAVKPSFPLSSYHKKDFKKAFDRKIE